MRLTGLVKVAPRRAGDLEPKKPSHPRDEDATHNTTTEHNHPSTIPVFVELVKHQAGATIRQLRLGLAGLAGQGIFGLMRGRAALDVLQFRPASPNAAG
jgi:hypothetical protein